MLVEPTSCPTLPYTYIYIYTQIYTQMKYLVALDSEAKINEEKKIISV